MAAPVRKGLTRERILREAFSLIDAGGVEALTMRSLAARLKTATMAVYNHFQDRDAILDGLAEQAFVDLSTAATKAAAGRRATNPRARIRAIVLAGQYLASAHPQIYQLAMTRREKPPTAQKIVDEVLEALREAGLSRRDSLAACNTLVLMLQGFPFWREAYSAKSVPGEQCHVDADLHFAASVDWILSTLPSRAQSRKRLQSA